MIYRIVREFPLIAFGFPILIIEYKNRNAYYRGLDRNEDDFVIYFFRKFVVVYGERKSRKFIQNTRNKVFFI